MITIQSPRKVPTRDSITGLRLCSGILTKSDFPLVYITAGSAKNDDYRGKTEHTEYGKGKVRSGEERPSLHGVV
jgi:hypothetical protein